jgi:L-ascorbate metabolism protein UlaG (beta-lactamase superfamily)
MQADKFPPKNNVYFSWINNYAGVQLKTPSRNLLIDPVDIKAKNYPQLDAILITHEHYDHLDQQLIIELQKTTGCIVIADAASAQKLKMYIPAGKLLTAHVGDETFIGDVRIKTAKCRHPANSPVTYIITSEDGLKIFHTADSLPYPDMAMMAQKEQIDLVFCTVGIAPGASPEAGSEIAWLIKPKIAVPYHTNSVQSQKKFADILRKELPKTSCVIPEIGKVYQVFKGEKKNEE